MALKTAGSLTTSNLKGAQFSHDPGALSNADFASIVETIYYDTGAPAVAFPKVFPEALSRAGLLYIPDRGVLKVKETDWVLYTPDGWPILLSQRSLPKTLTATGDTHTSTTLNNMSVNVTTLGWMVGTPISSSNGDLPAGCYIKAISADGKTITLSAAATGTNVGGTITAGSFTHS